MKSLTLLVVILCASLCIAETINVNPNGTADYQTIQQAINNANNDDTVIVAPATYYENVDFIGKAITVTSTDPEDWAVVESTIINANDVNSAVIFTNSEGPASIITGFTITGGVGTAVTGLFTSRLGAGVCCYYSSPTITKNIIIGNTGGSASGGGVGGLNSNAIVTRNIIKQNTASNGGGVANWYGNMKVSNNLIYENIASTGGGITSYNNGGEFINNTLVDNSSTSIAENIYAYGDFIISNNIIFKGTSDGESGINIVGANIYTFSYNNVFGGGGGDYGTLPDQAGINGNISVDPLFVNEDTNDFHLQPLSLCVNTGDPAFVAGVGETDIDGDVRVSSSRLDIGADEFTGNTVPIADAGGDRNVFYITSPVALDGSGSFDPEGVTITYSWQQIAGPTVSLDNANIVNPSFTPPQFGIYTFGLTVNDGTYDSLVDTIVLTIINTAPIAKAGDDQYIVNVPATVTLDAGESFDYDHDVLIKYRWQQIAGTPVTLDDPNAAVTTFAPSLAGVYIFELIVSDEFGDSVADTIIVDLGNCVPRADAGSSRYVYDHDITLDGSKSYDPDTSGTLTYSWRQTFGPNTIITNGDTATPTIGGFVPTDDIQICQYELTVSDGTYTSLADATHVTIVHKNYDAVVAASLDPPVPTREFRFNLKDAQNSGVFDVNKPTIIHYGGGNCLSRGGGYYNNASWEDEVNILAASTYLVDVNYVAGKQTWKRMANEAIVYLSSVAPDYKMPIQVTGFSTGGMPCTFTARFLNETYNDPRYNVNMIATVDALGCPFNFDEQISTFLANPVDGEQCIAQNYPETNMEMWNINMLNVYMGGGHVFTTYSDTIDIPASNLYNDGVVAGYYLSVAGPAKNLQISNPAASTYYFRRNVTTSAWYMFDEPNYLSRIPEPVTLSGPADGAAVDANGAVLSCQISQNVTGYQLLVGSDEYRVMDYIILSDTLNPPTDVVTLFPSAKTWWTVRAYNQYGATIYADPCSIIPDVVTPITRQIKNVTTFITYNTIQQAIDEAVDGDVIVLSASAYPYVESIDLAGKAIILKSQDPTDPAVVASTIIRGSDYAPVAAFTNGEDANTLLDGLTITGGTAGILCDASSPTISNCTITDNADAAIDLRNNSKPMLVNCTIDGLIANHLVENITKGQTYGSIQQAIDDANDNDQIVVHPSVYRENIDFAGKNLTLRSTDPLDSDNAAGTVIKALDPMIPTVTFINAENANCTLAGFTITEGYSGIYCDASSPIISNCIITGNSADNGGGIRCDNSAAPRIDGCLISENYAADWGGGVCRSFAEISNSVIINNRAEFSGGGIYVHSAAITNCLIVGNYPEGIDLSRNSTLVEITNCTIVENYAQGLDMGKPVFRNCIVAGNDEAGTNVQISGVFANVEYCLVEGGFAGTGNIDDDPCFATSGSWADVNTWNQGDYHLKSEFGRWDPTIKAWTIDAVTSAAIDAGDANSLWQGEKWPHGAQVNLGVYGNTVEASMSPSQAGNQGDANNDLAVNLWDFTELAFNWNETAKCVYADLNADAAVNEFDLKILTDNWLWTDFE